MRFAKINRFLHDVYPETLQRLVVLNIPGMFGMIGGLFKPLLPSATRNKISLTKRRSRAQRLVLDVYLSPSDPLILHESAASLFGFAPLKTLVAGEGDQDARNTGRPRQPGTALHEFCARIAQLASRHACPSAAAVRVRLCACLSRKHASVLGSSALARWHADVVADREKAYVCWQALMCLSVGVLRVCRFDVVGAQVAPRICHVAVSLLLAQRALSGV